MDNIEIELMLMRAWPSIVEETYDGWILRSSEGYTKRANCVNPIVKSKIPLADKHEYCKKFYNEKKLPLIYKIIDSNEVLEVDRFLEEKGLKKQNEVSVEEIDISKKKMMTNDIYIKWTWDERWINFFSKETKLHSGEEKILKRILQKNKINTFYASKIISNEIVASALGVVEKNNLSIFSVYVKESHRGIGIGEEIVEGVLHEGSKIGVTRGYLQVLKSNENALKLYKKMGFVQKYRCWYRY